jgi:hypothetical protein
MTSTAPSVTVMAVWSPIAHREDEIREDLEG